MKTESEVYWDILYSCYKRRRGNVGHVNPLSQCGVYGDVTYSGCSASLAKSLIIASVFLNKVDIKKTWFENLLSMLL